MKLGVKVINKTSNTEYDPENFGILVDDSIDVVSKKIFLSQKESDIYMYHPNLLQMEVKVKDTFTILKDGLYLLQYYDDISDPVIYIKSLYEVIKTEEAYDLYTLLKGQSNEIDTLFYKLQNDFPLLTTDDLQIVIYTKLLDFVKENSDMINVIGEDTLVYIKADIKEYKNTILKAWKAGQRYYNDNLKLSNTFYEYIHNQDSFQYYPKNNKNEPEFVFTNIAFSIHGNQYDSKPSGKFIKLSHIFNVLELSNVTNSMRNIPEKWKSSNNLIDPNSHVQDMLTVNEAGLYKLILRSNKPVAEKFQDWVCETVLPSIRKNGEYILQEYKEKIEKQQKEIKILENKCVKSQSRIPYKERNVIYMIQDKYHKLERIFVIGKAVSLTDRLSSYNKTRDHEVIYYRECNSSQQMSCIERCVLYKLDKYRETSNRDRFILPNDKDVSLFTNAIDLFIDAFKDVDSNVNIETDTKETKIIYTQDNKENISYKHKQYTEDNKDELFVKRHEYNDNNKEILSLSKVEHKKKIKEIYKKDNFSAVAVVQKEYYDQNKEAISLYAKEYREDHKEDIKKNQHDYYEENKENMIKYKKQYYQDNKELSMKTIFPWDQIVKHFDGVWHSGYSDQGFMYGWDVESTAWFDTSFLQLVGEVPVAGYDDDDDDR